MFGSLRGEGGSGRGKNEGLWEERAFVEEETKRTPTHTKHTCRLLA
jgi:hypothetical protein